MNKMLVAAVALMVSGCGDSNIQTVKQTSLSLDRSISIGNALDNRKICSHVSWSETKDERERVVVGYVCEIPVSYINDNIKQDTKAYVKDKLFRLMNNRRYVLNKINELNKQLEKTSEIAKLKREISDYEKVANEDYERDVAKLQSLIDTSDSIKATSINQYVNFSVVGSEVQPYSCYFTIKTNEDISLSYLEPYDCLKFAYLSTLNDSFAKQLQSFTFDIFDSYLKSEAVKK